MAGIAPIFTGSGLRIRWCTALTWECNSSHRSCMSVTQTAKPKQSSATPMRLSYRMYVRHLLLGCANDTIRRHTPLEFDITGNHTPSRWLDGHFELMVPVFTAGRCVVSSTTTTGTILILVLLFSGYEHDLVQRSPRKSLCLSLQPKSLRVHTRRSYNNTRLTVQ